MTKATETPAALLSAEELDKLEAIVRRAYLANEVVAMISPGKMFDLIAHARAAAPVVAQTNDLPPLPMKAGTACDDGYWVIGKDGPLAALPYGASVRCEFFTADQMRDYARTALAAPVAAQADTTEPSAANASGLYAAALLAVERMRGCAATYIEDHAKDTYPGQLGLRPQDVATMWAQEIHGIDAKVYLDEAIEDLKVATSAGEADTTASVSPAAQAIEAPTYWNSQRKIIERAIIGLRDGWATRKDANDALAALGAAQAQPAAAPAEPVAWMDPSAGCVMDAFLWQKDAANPQYSVPVYVAPVAAAAPADDAEDAARYRFLRNNANTYFDASENVQMIVQKRRATELPKRYSDAEDAPFRIEIRKALDEAVDAAMKKGAA